jgi:hypothetical protein
MERYRVFWDASFDRLDAHLHRVQRDRAGEGRARPAEKGARQ